MSEFDEPTINVRKIAYTLPVSTQLLYEHGVITREQAEAMGYTPPPPPTRWQRWKWARRQWWYDHKPHMHIGPCPADHGDDY